LGHREGDGGLPETVALPIRGIRSDGGATASQRHWSGPQDWKEGGEGKGGAAMAHGSGSRFGPFGKGGEGRQSPSSAGGEEKKALIRVTGFVGLKALVCLSLGQKIVGGKINAGGKRRIGGCWRGGGGAAGSDLPVRSRVRTGRVWHGGTAGARG